MPPKPYQPSKKTPAKPTWLGSVQQFLTDDSWPHETVQDGSAVLTRYQGQRGVFDVTIEVEESVGLVVVHAQLPVDLGDEAPESAVSAVAELCLRVNAGLAVGSLDLDLDDGTLRFRLGMVLDGVPPLPEPVRNALYTTVDAADRFLPLVSGVAAGEFDVEAALGKLAEA